MKQRKKRITRADRNSPEAAAEETGQEYRSIGKTDLQILKEKGKLAEQEPGPNPGAVPTDGN